MAAGPRNKRKGTQRHHPRKQRSPFGLNARGAFSNRHHRALAKIAITCWALGIGDTIGLVRVPLSRGPDNFAILGRTPPPPAILCLVNLPKITKGILTTQHLSPPAILATVAPINTDNLTWLTAICDEIGTS